MILEKYHNYIMENESVEYSVSFESLPPVPAAHKWVGAQCIGDCVYGIPNDMNGILKHTSYGNCYVGEVGNGLFKWTGGCVWDGFLYGFSRTSNNLLKMALDTEEIDYISLDEGYLREHHYGGITTKEGLVYQPPRDTNHILVWDLKTEKTKRIYLRAESDNRDFRYCGSVLHPNGYIYFLPEMAGKVIKLDTKTEKWAFIGKQLDGMVFDAKIAADGNIYGYSAYCKGILKINIQTDCTEMIHTEIAPGAFGTKVGVNGHLYSIPGDGDHVWDFNPLTDTLKKIYTFEEPMRAKFAGGTSMRNGSICAVPAEGDELFWLKPNEKKLAIPENIWSEYFIDYY